MARINIEDSFFTKKSWLKLVVLLQDDEKALGAVVRAWIVAQKFWKEGQKIPRSEWEKEELNDALIKAGIATESDDGIYCHGSETQFAWLIQRSDAGKKSAESRRKKAKKKKARKKVTKNAGDRVVEPNSGNSNDRSSSLNETERDSTRGNEAEPLTLTLPLSPSLSLSHAQTQDFVSSNEETTSQNQRRAGTKESRIIGQYCELWNQAHGSNPDITGKDAGIVKRLAKNIGEDRLMILLEAYFQRPNSFAEKRFHPLEVFESGLKEIAAYADSGKLLTDTDSRNRDKAATVASQLQRFRDRGKS